MAARGETAVGVEGDAPTRTGLPRLDQLVALALTTEAEQLVVLEFLVHERVVAERHADVLRSEGRRLVTLERGVTGHRRRADDGADERVPPRVRLGLQRRGERPHQRAIRLTRPHDVLARQDHAGGTVVGRATHHGREGLRHHARRQYLLRCDHVIRLAVRHR